MRTFLLIVWYLAEHHAADYVDKKNLYINRRENKEIENLQHCKCIHFDYCDPFGFINEEVRNPHHFR